MSLANSFQDLRRLYERMDRELEQTPLTSQEINDLHSWSHQVERTVDKWIVEWHNGRCLEVESRKLFRKSIFAAMLSACAADRYFDALDRGWPPDHREEDGRRCNHEHRYR